MIHDEWDTLAINQHTGIFVLKISRVSYLGYVYHCGPTSGDHLPIEDSSRASIPEPRVGERSHGPHVHMHKHVHTCVIVCMHEKHDIYVYINNANNNSDEHNDNDNNDDNDTNNDNTDNTNNNNNDDSNDDNSNDNNDNTNNDNHNYTVIP